MFLIILAKLKRIYSYVLTLIQNAINFVCINIEQVQKQDLVLATGDILKIILMNFIIAFVASINKTTFSKINGSL